MSLTLQTSQFTKNANRDRTLGMKWKIWKFKYLKDLKIMNTAENIY